MVKYLYIGADSRFRLRFYKWYYEELVLVLYVKDLVLD
jgi:hypothetical protein